MSETRYCDDIQKAIADTLGRWGTQKALLLTSPSRRFCEAVLDAASGIDLHVYDRARVHVPRECVNEAQQLLDESQADTLIALGGGAVIGLGKALRRNNNVRFVAIPTTYAGSEQTNIYGVLEDGRKQTGRDERVRPELVLYHPPFSAEIPKKLSIQSLFNAMAHPIGALASGADGELKALAERAIATAFRSAEELVKAPRSTGARKAALEAAAACGQVLDQGQLGLHHRIAHFVGGHFDLPHAAVHSVLLAHTVFELSRRQPEVYEAVQKAAGVSDLPGALATLLAQAGAPTSLAAIGIGVESLAAAMAGEEDLPQDLVRRAHCGGRISDRMRFEDWGLPQPVALHGPALENTTRVVIAVHGRGSNAPDIIRRALEVSGDNDETLIIAPQAVGCAWYEASFSAPLADFGVQLEGAIASLATLVTRVRKDAKCAPWLFGFSQGACLAVEFAARSNESLAGVIAIAGARIGPVETQPAVSSALKNTPVLLGTASEDKWVPRSHVQHTQQALEATGARVTTVFHEGDAHRITARQRIAARELLLGIDARAGLRGFGNTHESESLPGALPTRQNSPRRPAYGLFAEQVNATGFTAPREANRRAWLYRIRPSAQHTAFEPLAHSTCVLTDPNAAPEPNLAGWRPLPWPDHHVDFVDGLTTLGGAGQPALRRGFSVHLYAANRSMEDRCFYNADGSMLIVPQEGAFTLLTELGPLEVAPGHIAIVPRGLKISILPIDGPIRGWVGEVYGRYFSLPPRGPSGANGLSDARHFRAPTAFHENRLAPSYRVVSKVGGSLFEAEQDFSPFDVAAWHGNYAPYVYDLADFSPVGNLRFDHGDPSLFTVLTSGLDEAGAHSLDFVYFPPRWDVTEGTFRPPFFHRNAVTEINGIVRDPDGDKPPFYAGGTFVTPPMTAHGVRAASVEAFSRMTDAQADQPHRFDDRSLWWQFESALPMALSEWAKTSPCRIDEWPHMWGAYRAHYPAGLGSRSTAGTELDE